MIKPQPFTYICPCCGWKKTVAPTSDVMVPGVNYFDSCQKCGHPELETRAAGVIDVALLKLLRRPQHD